MPRKAKKLQEIKEIFEENEIDFTLFDDVVVLKELRERLGIITDTRHESYIKHNLLDIIMITLLAVLANANEWLEIEHFGKTSCGSKRNKTEREAVKALHTLNVYSSDYGFCTGQVFVDEKRNEIPAMIDLLKIIDIKGCILTWDALNTQRDTVAEVKRKKGDYVGALKGNQHNF